jgi:hypothetical protein
MKSDARHAKYQYLKAWTLIKKNPHSEKTRLLTVLSPVQFSSVRTILPLQKAGYPDLSEADDCYSEAASKQQHPCRKAHLIFRNRTASSFPFSNST